MSQTPIAPYIKVCIPNLPKGIWTYKWKEEFGICQVGTLVWVTLGRRKCWGVVLELSNTIEGTFEVKPAEEVVTGFLITKTALSFYQWMAEYYFTSLNRVLDVALPVKLPELLQISDRERKLNMGGEIQTNLPPLTHAQQKVNTTFSDLMNRGIKNILLHGVTGSGKTRLMAEWALGVLKLGKQVLWLVPEIALTPQTKMRMESYFGRRVDVMHSSLKLVEKRELWRRLAEGKVEVLLGTRSAILAPLQNLGLIIVDEEHDQSYKQADPSPRYQAKDLALMKAHRGNFPVVFASATPSLESHFLVAKKKMTKLVLDQRAMVLHKPKIELIDRNQYQKVEGKNLFSSKLREEIQEALTRGEQVILLHNRRGYATANVCDSCGCTQKCLDCTTNLVWHKNTGRMHCHLCARIYFPQNKCSECSEGTMEFRGAGVQQTEEELLFYIPGVKVLRMDRDTATTESQIRKILDDFREGKAQVLIGTQMVAKGHDFPNVQLVGVIDGDTGLHLPDFRSSERLFQMLTQVAGRAGRAQGQGRVLIQTWDPQHPIVQYALKDDYNSFVEWEINNRQLLNYPPFSRWMFFDLVGKSKVEVQKKCTELLQIAKGCSSKYHGVVKGPLEPLLGNVKGKSTLRLILLCAQAPALSKWYAEIETRFKISKTMQISVDRDPQSVF